MQFLLYLLFFTTWVDWCFFFTMFTGQKYVVVNDTIFQLLFIFTLLKATFGTIPFNVALLLSVAKFLQTCRQI